MHPVTIERKLPYTLSSMVFPKQTDKTMQNKTSKEIKSLIKSKLHQIKQIRQDIETLKDQLSTIQNEERSAIKARKPYGRSKNYAFHPCGKWHVNIRNSYLGYYSEYFNTEKEAYDRVTAIYIAAGLTDPKYIQPFDPNQ